MRDKVVIITGGASGIGEGMVRRFCAEGARVIVTDIDAAGGSRVATECGAHFFEHDVADEASWLDLAGAVAETTAGWMHC